MTASTASMSARQASAESTRLVGTANWWEPRYENHSTLDKYLGDKAPFWLEVVAVRVAQWFNGCYSLDWCHENWVTTAVRETAPGFRIGCFFTYLTIVVFSSYYLDEPLLLQRELNREGFDMSSANLTLRVTFWLWSWDQALLCLAYCLCRWHGTPPRPGDDGELTPFYRITTRRLREHRKDVAITGYQAFMFVCSGIFYASYFVLAGLSFHTVLSQMYVPKNGWFAAMLVMLMVISLLASMDDLSQIGSPWGIQESSKVASFLISLRALFVHPIVLWWSVCSILATFPPSVCKTC